MSDLITISSSMLPATTRVVGVRGYEAISRPYHFDISLVLPSDDSDFDPVDAIGAKARLVIDRASDSISPYVFAGVLGSIEMLHEFDGRALVRATLVPRLWQLGLSRHSRMFTKKSAPDVIKAILEDNGLSGDDYQLLLGSYETEEHICQYRESDLDFISRWMEREGIYYYFEHTDDGEKLIIADDLTYPEEGIGKPVRYHAQLGQDRSAGASFRSFSSRHTTLPVKVKLKDYDYARPNLDVSGSAPVADNGAGEVSLHGERFFTPAAGKRLAKLRAEELLARQVVYHAAGTRLHLRSGHTFELEDHPRAAFNTKYVAVEVHHHGNQSGGLSHFKDLLGLEHEDVYFAEVSAIPAATQFRPECRTAWPRIYGFEGGVVDGPAWSEYAQIDDQGRYLVKFQFDEGNLKDGTASTYVRMMQPHGGGIEGFHFPLRRSTEVVFTFLGGDPDRPVITGVVPNALTPSPVTAGNHTKNVLQTGGRNRLELEDQAGQQRITLSTPYSNTYLRMGSPNDSHELILKTEDRGLADFGQSLEVYTGTWRKDHVKSGYFDTTVDGTVTDIFNGTHTTTVKNKITETYNEGHETTVNAAVRKSTYNIGQDTTVNGGLTKEAYNVGHLTEVLAGQTLKVEGNQTLDIQTDKKEDISGKSEMTIGGTLTETVTGAHTITTGARTEIVKGDYTQDVQGIFTQTTQAVEEFWKGNKSSHTYGLHHSINIGAKAAINIAASAELNLSASLILAAGIKLEARASASITATAALDINVGSVSYDNEACEFKTKGCGIRTLGTAIQMAGVQIFA